MIDLQHVYFSYEHGEYLLEDINMTIRNGDYISVVGENGSGKSTLIKLILGLLVPSRGVIPIPIAIGRMCPSALKR